MEDRPKERKPSFREEMARYGYIYVNGERCYSSDEVDRVLKNKLDEIYWRKSTIDNEIRKKKRAANIKFYLALALCAFLYYKGSSYRRALYIEQAIRDTPAEYAARIDSLEEERYRIIGVPGKHPDRMKGVRFKYFFDKYNWEGLGESDYAWRKMMWEKRREERRKAQKDNVQHEEYDEEDDEYDE